MQTQQRWLGRAVLAGVLMVALTATAADGVRAPSRFKQQLQLVEAPAARVLSSGCACTGCTKTAPSPVYGLHTWQCDCKGSKACTIEVEARTESQAREDALVVCEEQTVCGP